MKYAASLVLCLLTIGATAAEEDQVDLTAVHRIKQEAFKNGKVMDHLFYLTDVHGPRLSGSPEYQKAAEWAVKQLQQLGISNARLESWGRFGRSWSLRKFSAYMTKPSYVPLHAHPQAWSPSTNGLVRGTVVYAPALMPWQDWVRSDPDRFLEAIRKYSAKYKGQLRGKIVLIDPLQEFSLPTEAPTDRYDEKELSELYQAPEPFPTPTLQWPIRTLPEDEKERGRLLESLPLEIEADLWDQQQKSADELNAFMQSEGVLAVFAVSRRGIGGTLYAQEGNSWHADAPLGPPSIMLEPEQYRRLVRLVQKQMNPEVEIDLQVSMPDAPVDGTNVIAELPGSKKRDEVVMLGAHLDSWHGGTGATDNAAGCSVMIEVMRILKVLNLPLNRTVRVALWGGEEQALYGSRAYVQKYFADPLTMQLRPDHGKISGYFNVDNGTGKIRGVYLQGNDMMRPIFENWFAPFRDLGVTTLTIRNTDGTDHLSFEAVGIPGFQFIQDDVEYSSRTHHSNLDVYDHIQPADLMQAAAVVASVVYHTANRNELLPRKPLPRPLPPKTTAK